ALYPPTTKLPPTAASVISVNAPPAMFGDDISRTPPSKKLLPARSKSKLWRKTTCATVELIAIPGVSRRLSLCADGSSTKTALGALSGVAVDVTQSGAGPTALFATQPGGNAGAVTASKFSLKTVRVQAVGMELTAAKAS